MPDIIDFETEKERRIDAAIMARDDRWQGVSHEMALVMEASGLDQTSMVEAALWAIIETLDTDTYNSISRHDAKALIAECLNEFR